MARSRKTALLLAPNTPALPESWARLIGVKSTQGITQEPNPAEPETMLDHALHWAERGIHVFPCARFLGRPLIPEWYGSASSHRATVVEWWSRWPTADIGAVPDRSGFYVVAAFKDERGLDSLADLEDAHGALPAAFRTENTWGDVYLWLHGSAYTSHHKVGAGIHVLGVGQRVFMPASWAPHLVYRG